MTIARHMAAFASRAARLLAGPVSRLHAVRKLTLDRRVAASSIVACALSGMILYAAGEQQILDTARAERDAKLRLLERLSPGKRSQESVTSAASLLTPFVVAETSTTAAAEADRRIRAVTAEANGVVLSTQASVEQGSDAATRRIEVQAVIEGQLDAVQRSLFNLETGPVLMFIDELTLQPVERNAGRTTNPQSPLLQVSLTLSAFWRSGP
jgi:hypothetical protein